MFKVCLQKMNEFFFSMIVFSFWFLGFCFFLSHFLTRLILKNEKENQGRKTFENEKNKRTSYFGFFSTKKRKTQKSTLEKTT